MQRNEILLYITNYPLHFFEKSAILTTRNEKCGNEYKMDKYEKKSCFTPLSVVFLRNEQKKMNFERIKNDVKH